MKIVIPKEQMPGERRVAATPETVRRYRDQQMEILVQSGAGESSYHGDDAYTEAGASIVADADTLYAEADVVLKVQPPSEEEVGRLGEGAMVIGFLSPAGDPGLARSLCDRRITGLAMELIPPIARAQSMDAVASQDCIAGYQGMMIGAQRLGKMVPMMTTPSANLQAAKVLVIGAGAMGLQAIATARRLGAVVCGYDVRGGAQERVESLGAQFLHAAIEADWDDGPARELNPEEESQQQALLTEHLADADVVITTVMAPGRPAPRIITRAMLAAMQRGAIIVDLAADAGGNCEMSQPGRVARGKNIDICAPLNVPSSIPVHASEMYANNLYNLLALMVTDGRLEPDWEDEILREATLTRDGEIKHAATATALEGGSP